MFFLKKKDYQSSINQLEEIIKIFPNELNSIFLIIQCYIKLNNPKKALVYINDGLGVNQDKIDAAIEKINNITFKPTAGEVYNVTVIKILDFGAVVEFVPGNEVLLHISEISWDRIDKVTDEINLGDTFDVKYFGIDPKTRKQKVSRKALLPRPERK